jgi:predicted aspartyl protease
MDAGRQIAALNDVGLTINPSEQPYATIQVKVKNGSGREFQLSLLLDTACSGLVLRPSVVKRYNLPSYSNPVTMTGAGGTTGATGLTQINQVEFGGETMSGSMPAAVQDIGALPSSLDGIIGLSMLSQFACVEMDFRRGMLTLYKKDRRPPVPDNLKIVAEAEMRITKLGIWICDVMLDGRGPVRMLVDSGAASSFLNWKGVSDLGLSRDSPLLRPNSSTGAMGSDNVAMRLTNRLFVQQNLNLGWRPAHDGLVVSGKDIAVDIGDIAVLETLSGDGVGGILGIDVLMRCALVRMTFNGPVPRITLMN